jgi:hypothetical protein
MDKIAAFSQLLDGELRKHEERFSPQSSSTPFLMTRSGSSRAHDIKKGSSHPMEHLESRSATSMPHSPKNGGRVGAGSKSPLEILRRQASKEKLERYFAVRGSLKQRLHDYTAAVFFKQLSGSEQAAWWCGVSRAPPSLSEERARPSKEYLSAEDAGFVRLPREGGGAGEETHLAPAAASKAGQPWAQTCPSSSSFTSSAHIFREHPSELELSWDMD